MYSVQGAKQMKYPILVCLIDARNTWLTDRDDNNILASSR